MMYKFDKNSLTFKNITNKVILTYLLISVTVASVVGYVMYKHINDINLINQETRSIILKESTEFSPEKLRAYILELNIKFPHIVYAQARLETGNFQSDIFKQNNNLFGMRVATTRPTTNKGEENGHAYFNNWRESVVDYAFFQAAYLNKITNEDEYFQYLKANYAEDTTYVTRLKEIMKENNNLFHK